MGDRRELQISVDVGLGRVFSPKTAQMEVFEEVKPLATSVLDGYNVLPHTTPSM